MNNVKLNDVSLIEKLKTEIRFCPECNFEVRHPLVERCPRCFHTLPQLQRGCTGCIHEMICPVAKD